MTSKLLNITAKAVGLLAIIIGLTAKFAPHLFFKVPNIGFILFAVTGGSPIPPYISSDPFLPENRGWLKQDDVIVTVAAKSGTTWMMYCSHQIRVKGDDEKYPFSDINMVTPWPGLIQTPGEGWEPYVREQMNSTILPDGSKLKDYWDNEEYPFRIFKSHDVVDTYGDLIGGDKVKFLAMARNGLDMAASFVPFFDKHSDEFRSLWGNFPPVEPGTAEEKAALRLRQLLPGQIFEDFYFPYINSWWKARNEKNVLLLHYSDAKKDLSGTVKKIANFYGVKLNAKEHKTVVEKCGFPYMKERTHLFNYQLPLNSKFDGRIMTNGSMTRKGNVGDGKVTFTDEDRELWMKAEEESFGDDPAKLNWARNGGGFD